jgi:hypothetical protein
MTEERGSRPFDWAWLLAWGVAGSVWCVSASARLGATFDEPTYVRLGLESWRTGSSGRLLDLGTMPLPVHVHTLPLYLWERWIGEPFDADRDLARLLPVARWGALPFWWLLLASGWRIGREAAGRWGGRLAVVFLACEPNLLAHATLATTDVAVSAALLSLLISFRRGRGAAWLRRVGIPAAWFALVVLCKASGLAFGVMGMAVVQMGSPRTDGAEAPSWYRRILCAFGALRDRGFRRDLAQIGTLGLVVVFVYCGSDWRASPSFVEWARQLPDGLTRSVTVWCAEHLRIFSNAGAALVRQVRHNVQGHGVFLDGEVARRALWYYFPVALSIKATVPLLTLPLLLIVVSPRALGNWVCRVALTLLLFSLVCRVQIGIRLMLPLLSLAAVGLAVAVTQACQQYDLGARRRLLSASAVVGVTWMAWAAVHVWPHGLCYTNEIWGGTAEGYRRLSDSNYDWGQGLKDLARWQRRHKAADLDVLYFGTDTALPRLPMHSVAIEELAGKEASDFPRALQGRTFAISTTILYGSVSEMPQLKPLVTCLRQQRPADRTSTFLIFRFPADQASAARP